MTGLHVLLWGNEVKTWAGEEKPKQMVKKRGRPRKTVDESAQEKRLKDCMQRLLDMPVCEEEKQKKLVELGIDQGATNRTLLLATLFQKAVENGDMAAFKEIKNLLDEETGNGGNGNVEKLIEGVKNKGK